jgi:hypothetical protein
MRRPNEIFLNHFSDSQKIGRAAIRGIWERRSGAPARVGAGIPSRSLPSPAAGLARESQRGQKKLAAPVLGAASGGRDETGGTDYAARAASISTRAATTVIGTHASIRAVFSSRS